MTSARGGDPNSMNYEVAYGRGHWPGEYAVNAAHARYLEVRRLLLIGRLDEAERRLVRRREVAMPISLGYYPRSR
jgi:hypothetical protein